MTGTNVRELAAKAWSTDVFGRVLCNAREQHFVIDGPTWNGCPGEALTPGEAFLAAVLIEGSVDRENPARDDMTVFNRVSMRFDIRGATEDHAASLVDRVGRRCPLYGSVAASAEFDVEVHAT